MYNATVRVQEASSFPVDHTPILLYLLDFTSITPPSAVQHTARIVNPQVLTPAMKNWYQKALDEFLLTRSDTLEDGCQNFSTAVLQAAEKIFGPPANLTAVPAVIQRAQTDIEPFVKQHPHWWKDTAHILTYHNKKARVTEAWDLVLLERKLHISIITAHTTNETNAPRKPLYQRIFRTRPQTRIEAMFVSGIPKPADVHGLVGLDQFRHRHLAPPLRVEAEHIRYYMKRSRLTIPDLQFTV